MLLSAITVCLGSFVSASINSPLLTDSAPEIVMVSGATPVPVKLTARSAVLLLMMIEPVRDPVVEGVKNTVISQVPAGATDALEQVWTALNSAEFAMITDDTCNAAFPVFVSFKVNPALLVPVGVLGNERLVGEIVIAGCGGVAPVPFRTIDVVPRLV